MQDLKDKYSVKNLPTLKVKCEMSPDEETDTIEIINSGVDMAIQTITEDGTERAQINIENPVNDQEACRLIKENMDKRFGPTWQCVIGEGMSFEIKYQQNWMFFGVMGTLGIILYKS